MAPFRQLLISNSVLQRTSLWLPLRVIRGSPLPNISWHHLSLITRPTCSSLPGLYNQPARVASLRSLVLPRWTFPSISHCVVYPVIDWFRFTPPDWLLPAFWPQPWTLTTLSCIAARPDSLPGYVHVCTPPAPILELFDYSDSVCVPLPFGLCPVLWLELFLFNK